MTKKFKPEWEEKCWGSVQHIFVGAEGPAPAAALSKLQIDAGWRCSRHLHEHRYNLFSVTLGIVVIEEWGLMSLVKTTTVLRPGDVLVVPPMTVHRFRVVQPGSLVELYWSDNSWQDCTMNDIVRFDMGGRDTGVPLDFKRMGL